MHLKRLELSGFKSFAKKTTLSFGSPITAIVGPNGSGKSNVAESFRFVLGEQSIKSMRGKRGEDLIFNGSKTAPRANRASVKIVFDNSSRFLNIDFDEVLIERAVHRDGVNEYSINGSRVRLRDVMEFLASANIGATGHHIISQGETDRILNANSKERREMIEDALGLKIYHYKKEESERRLEKTNENIAHVESLRKEIAPHLSFLKKQAEKVEKAAAMRDELVLLYKEYLKREHEYLSFHKDRIAREKEVPMKALHKLTHELTKAKEIVEHAGAGDAESRRALELERTLSEARKEKETLVRELGRLEGQMAFEEKRLQREKNVSSGEVLVPLSELDRLVMEAEQVAATSGEINDAPGLRNILAQITASLRAFVTRQARLQEEHKKEAAGVDLADLRKEKQKIDEKMADAMRREEESTAAYRALQKEIEDAKDESRQAEREMFRLMGEEGRMKAELASLEGAENALLLEEEDFKRELGEAGALAGREVLAYETFNLGVTREAIASEKRSVQDERRRKLEKIKIRLEEFGGSTGEDVMKEYKEAQERDTFLEREIADLHASAESLKQLITELEEKLGTQFKEGISKINAEFTKFFELMFGGGSALLTVLKAVPRRRRSDTSLDDLRDEVPQEIEEETEEGIDINVNLPHKRVKGLQMLSGGERALTSIALLFAMSQVNPPPFVILDETDAALDEANSKRYGDMVASLAQKSQLILITHNRETMSRAGILYGVTMGSDGVSKLLSVKFEEAVAVAK